MSLRKIEMLTKSVKEKRRENQRLSELRNESINFSLASDVWRRTFFLVMKIEVWNPFDFKSKLEAMSYELWKFSSEGAECFLTWIAWVYDSNQETICCLFYSCWNVPQKFLLINLLVIWKLSVFDRLYVTLEDSLQSSLFNHKLMAS